MEVGGAALGYDADLRSRGAAIFGRVVGREHLHFLYCVGVGAGDDLTVPAGANRGSLSSVNLVSWTRAPLILKVWPLLNAKLKSPSVAVLVTPGFNCVI